MRALLPRFWHGLRCLIPCWSGAADADGHFGWDYRVERRNGDGAMALLDLQAVGAELGADQVLVSADGSFGGTAACVISGPRASYTAPPRAVIQ